MPLIQNAEKYFYHRDEVYEGTIIGDKNQIVKVNDAVIDWNEGILRVVSVSMLDYIPVLEPWDPTENVDIDNNDASLITGLSGYQPSIISRAFYFVQTSVKKLVVDASYRVFGTDPTKYKIFLGTDTTNTGTILSDVDGNNLTSLPGTSNTQKIVPVTNINLILTEGQVVTVVIYTNSGTRVGEKTFIVKASAAMAPLNSSLKVISDVSLYGCPWIGVNPDLLEIPANYGMQIGTNQAIVNYVGGPPASIVPIDGTQCILLGMDNFNNNLAGITSYLTLVYNPDPLTEMVQDGNLNNQVTHNYQVVTIMDDMDLRYKVYLSIYYNPVTQMYGFRAYLSDLEYNELILLDPTHYTIKDNLGNPVSLSRNWHINNGVVNVVIRVDMSKVYPLIFDQFYFYVQQLDLDLNDATVYSHTWYLDYDPTHTLKIDGIYKFHTNQSNNYEDLVITGGANSTNEWKERFYNPLFTIYDVTPHVPTHFRIRYFDSNNTGIIYESNDIVIGNYNVALNTPGIIWRDKSTAEIIWLKDNMGNPKLELGMTPVLITAIYT